MRILVDENIPRITVESLRAAGHDVLDLRGTGDEGMVDNLLWRLAQREKRLLISTDAGFTLQRAIAHFGILIIRLRQPNRLTIHARIIEALERFSAKAWPNLTVVMRDKAQSVWRG